MENITLSEWSSIAQLIVAVFTVVAVISSLYLSIKALREVQYDRMQRQKPHLSFERGGYLCPICFVNAGKSIPGVNPMVVERLFNQMPDDAESIRIDDKKNDDGSFAFLRIGRLKNFGLGPALETRVTWMPLEVCIGQEKFKLDKKKLSEPIYSLSLNCMPTVPSHILPNEEAGLSRLPTFIEKDIEKKLTRVEGILKVEAKDVFDKRHLFHQEFRISTHYKGDKPNIIVTFGDLISSDVNKC